LADIFSQSAGWQQTKSAGINRVIGSGILLLLLAAHLTAQAQTRSASFPAQIQFEWRDSSGKVRSRSDLEEILREHREWIESQKKAGTQADLHDAKLDKANLVNVDLYASDMGGAKLNHAILSLANLSHSNLGDADLSAAHLDRANLTATRLDSANLSDADLRDTNLTGANLTSVNFTHAKLIGTDLTDAKLDGANFDGAVFEPKSFPTLSGISRAKNLELLICNDNPVPLVQLRKQLRTEDFGNKNGRSPTR